MSRPRDSYRSRVYKAEWATFDKLWVTDLTLSKEGAEAFCNRITTSPIWEAMDPKGTDVSCLHTGRKWGSHANTDRIVMGLGRWKEIVVHELAHVMTRRIHGAWTVAPHGKEFCGIYLFLLREFMGEAHAETLKRNFVKLKIPFEMPARVRLPKAA